jgi:hypothetical protein
MAYVYLAPRPNLRPEPEMSIVLGPAPAIYGPAKSLRPIAWVLGLSAAAGILIRVTRD